MELSLFFTKNDGNAPYKTKKDRENSPRFK